jgi:hypothetical protein
MVNYKNGKIYKIISAQTDNIYVGSSTQPLSVRMAYHRMTHERYNEGIGGYVTSSVLLEYPDAKIILIESYPCDNKEQLRAREQYHIDINKNICVNTNAAYTGLNTNNGKNEYLKQYSKTEKYKNYAVARRQTDKWKNYHRQDKWKQYQKEYKKTEKYKKKAREYDKTDKAKQCHKRLKQTTKYKEYAKRYEKGTHRKEYNKFKMSISNQCPCGGSYNIRYGRSRHSRTVTHQDFLKSLKKDVQDLVPLSNKLSENLKYSITKASKLNL